jgi:hypothetical protein
MPPNPLSWAKAGKEKSEVEKTVIAGGLFSITALRKTGVEETVYAKH